MSGYFGHLCKKIWAAFVQAYIWIFLWKVKVETMDTENEEQRRT